MFHFRGCQPVSRVAYLLLCNNGIYISAELLKMCTNSKSPDYALMFKFQYITQRRNPVSTSPLAQNAPEGPVLNPVSEDYPLTGGRSAAPPTPSLRYDISTPINKDTPLGKGVGFHRLSTGVIWQLIFRNSLCIAWNTNTINISVHGYTRYTKSYNVKIQHWLSMITSTMSTSSC